MWKVMCLLGLLNNGEVPQFSGFVQVDAAAGVEEADELGGSGAQVCRCVAKREVEDEKEKGENENAA